MHSVFKLRGSVKNYDWGKLGTTSYVAQLYKNAFPEFLILDDTPYAEMWMGTHSSGCSLIPEKKDTRLSEWLNEHPEELGPKILGKSGAVTGLPYLFKVLSVNKALSIQVHPDKQTAEILHNKFPDRYPDDNHKPELAIALSDFQALCGFRPLSEIQEFLIEIPQLQKLLSPIAVEKFQVPNNEKELKTVFTKIMTCSSDVFQPLLQEVYEKFQANLYESDLCKIVSDVFQRVCSEFPGDIGCFCVFFLNYLKLKPGEAIFLAANVPHAYIFGDCIECMACSDNVVRAGLTPKFKDVATLCNILSYSCKSAKENLFQYLLDENDPCLKVFNPPVKDFGVHQIVVPFSYKLYSLKQIESASILLVVKGCASYKFDDIEDQLSSGSVLFISSNSKIDIVPSSELLMFRAYCSN